MEYLVSEALEFIKENLSDKGKIFVGFSGGKDSIVSADLVKRSGLPFQLYYSQTGIDPPELVKFIRHEYQDCIFLKPKHTFWHLITRQNPPAMFSRWCCQKLKKEPSAKIPIQHRVLGIRAEESSKRAKYERIAEYTKTNQTLYYPIFHWNEGEVWEYIENRNLPYPELYDLGLSRLGCVVCPFNIRELNFHRQRWPRFYKLFEKKCHEWFEKRKSQGRKMYFDTADEFIENWYKGNVKWYAHNVMPGQMSIDDYISG